MLRYLGEIADAMVAEFGRTDAEVNRTVEIGARTGNGFTIEVCRTVAYNTACSRSSLTSSRKADGES